MTLIEAIREFFVERNGQAIHLQDLYARLPDEKEHSLRARIYERLDREFKRVGEGLYVALDGPAACVAVQGDSWEEIKRLPCGFADCLVTDPPYAWLDAVNKIHTTTRPRMRWTFERRDIDRALALEIYRVLKVGAHAFFFVPAETATSRPHIEGLIRLLESCGFRFNKRFVWYKDGVRGMGYNGRSSHEAILFMSKGKRRKPCDLSIGDVVVARPIDARRRRHGCEKPLPLLEAIIKFATKAGELVLDIFAGSLATGVAALRLGRSALLIEKDGKAIERALGTA